MTRYQTLLLLALLALPVLTLAETQAEAHAEGLAETSPEARLAAAGYALPPPTTPMAAYVTWRLSGNVLYLSGHGECRKDFTRGKVGKELSLEQGKQSAERVGLCMLATIKSAIGELSLVKQFLRIDGMVNATDDFGMQPEVVNGFSELMVVAFGEPGLGARAAVGMASLPRNIPVEISAIVELHD
jgi:enamine deaminase RidA (YjgF/YER057c/UK114 family)